MTRSALVTGATTGIGRTTALTLARLGYSVAITGRRLTMLRELSDEIEKTTGIEPYILSFDVRDKHAVFGSYDMLPDSWKQNLDIVVNNAGICLGDENFVDCDDHEWDAMIDTNIKGLLYVSQLAAQTMKKNGKGLIINISSVAGREPFNGGSVYSATKAAVDLLTKAMRAELHNFGIRVTSVAPGMVSTDFALTRHRGDVERAARDHEGKRTLSTSDVAAAIEFIVTRPEHICIEDLVITPVQPIDD